MIIKKSLLTIACTVVLLTGCSSANNKQDDGEGAGNSEFRSVSTEGMQSGCFYTREVSDWEALNNVNIIVYTGNKTRSYLLTINPPAVSLRGSSTIGFAGRDRICGRPGDRLVVATRGEHSVMDVRRLDAETLDGLLLGKQASGKQPIEPAEQSPGAELETDIKPDEGG